MQLGCHVGRALQLAAGCMQLTLQLRKMDCNSSSSSPSNLRHANCANLQLRHKLLIDFRCNLVCNLVCSVGCGRPHDHPGHCSGFPATGTTQLSPRLKIIATVASAREKPPSTRPPCIWPYSEHQPRYAHPHRFRLLISCLRRVLICIEGSHFNNGFQTAVRRPSVVLRHFPVVAAQPNEWHHARYTARPALQLPQEGPPTRGRGVGIPTEGIVAVSLPLVPHGRGLRRG